MAREALTAQELSCAGVTPSYTAAVADGHSIAGDGRTFLHVKNAGASSVTVTVQTPLTVDGLGVSDQTVTLAATTGDKMIGPFTPATFEQADGSVYIDYSAISGVTVAALRV